MTDRLSLPSRPELDGADTGLTTSEAPSDFGGLLAAVFQRVSDTIAGPNRHLLDPLVVDEDETETFLPTGPDAVDPDLIPSDEGEEFLPEPITDLPTTPLQAPPFDPASLPTPSEGNFVRTSSGMVRFTRGVGEAPDNKANRSHFAYQARAEFVTGAAAFVAENFDVNPAGQWRAFDAQVTANRSANSDHYSGGAFDVRAGSVQEAQRILVWASQQTWVAFAQIYPDGSLIHISANIAMFTGGAALPTTTEPSVPEPESRPVPPQISQGRPAPSRASPEPVPEEPVIQRRLSGPR